MNSDVTEPVSSPPSADPGTTVPDEPLSRAVEVMAGQMAEIMARPDGPFQRLPPPGHQRGIDFYPATKLLVVIAGGARRYRQLRGAYPQLTDPATLTEKIFWSKFFRPMKIPEAGNKLALAGLVPEEARSMIAIPEVVWRSAEARLPASKAIDAGTYYLKTNHGSDMFRRIEWPLADADRLRLEEEFADHLRNDFGYWGGEWWYLRFKREIFLERSISDDPYPIAWCCYTFGGDVARIIAYRKTPEGSHTFWMKPDFTPLEWQSANRPRTQFALPSPPVRKQMLDAAVEIGRRFSFVRVDFLLGDDETLYLSELTFSPGNGHMRWPDDMDLQFGGLWDLGR